MLIRHTNVVPQVTLIGPQNLTFACSAEGTKGTLSVLLTDIGQLMVPNTVLSLIEEHTIIEEHPCFYKPFEILIL